MADGFDPLDPSPYATLSVPKDASLATIRSAHRKLVLSCHPDKVQDESAKRSASERFHLVQQAYEILSDEIRRKRWDERKRLADLRTEIDQERGPLPRRGTDYQPSRTPQTPTFEMRGGRMYEERVPKSAKAASPNFYDDSFPSRPADSRSSRKYDDHYADMPSPRKFSGRGFDDRRGSREEEKLREKKAREAEAYAREESKRKRDKNRRSDKEAKFEYKKAYASDYSSDSDVNERYYSSRSEGKPKRRTDDRRNRRESPPRRSSKKETRELDEELYDKISHTKEYMKKSSESVDYEDRRPSSGRRRAESYRPPPPPSPPIIPIDPGRRSSGDDARRSSGRARNSRPPSPIRKSTKEKRKPDIEIVDPPPSHRKASQKPSSDSRNSKGIFSRSRPKPEPHRAQTFEPAQKYDHFDHPGLRRAETLPIHNMHRGPVPMRTSKPSTLKNMVPESSSSESSDSDSDATPIIEPPKSRSRPSIPREQSTKYKVHLEDDIAQTPRTVSVEPDDYFARSRDTSPRTSRRTSDRPPPTPRGAPNTRAPPLRPSHSYAPSPAVDRTPPRQKLSRADTEYMPPLNTNSSPRTGYFGEVVDSPKSHHSPKNYDDRHFRTSSRRGSEDVTDRDAYPGSHHRTHHRPNYSRGTVY